MQNGIDCFLVDIDGPVTGAFANVKPKAVLEFMKKANEGHKVFFVSGRSIDWVQKNLLPVINSFEAKFPNAVNNISFVGEHGLVTARISGGKLIREINRRISVPKNIMEKVRRQVKLIPGVFYDKTKQAVVTIEAIHEIKRKNPVLVEQGLKKTEKLMREISLKHKGFHVVRSLYAVDLLPFAVSKAFAADQALGMLGPQRRRVRFYRLFGDSPSDLRMIEPLRKRKLSYEFYFVGDKSKIKTEKMKEIKRIHLTKRKLFEGTIEAFREFRKRRLS
ncbi:MAG: hypothetical protein AB1467_05715 [Candidatus Diapherotrites archaeon]